MKSVACPTCGKEVEWSDASRWRPFCSERCKLIDLGEWFDEKNRLPGDSDDITNPDGEDIGGHY